MRKLVSDMSGNLNTIYETKSNEEIFPHVHTNAESISKPLSSLEFKKITTGIINQQSKATIDTEKRAIYLNKTIIEGKDLVDDIDNIDDEKSIFKSVFNNRKFILIGLIIMFICVCIVASYYILQVIGQ